jgi:hypothetical protein
LVEHLTFNQRVTGSNPVALTNKINLIDQKLNGKAMMFPLRGFTGASQSSVADVSVWREGACKHALYRLGLGGRITGHGGIKNKLVLQVTDLIADLRLTQHDDGCQNLTAAELHGGAGHPETTLWFDVRSLAQHQSRKFRSEQGWGMGVRRGGTP